MEQSTSCCPLLCRIQHDTFKKTLNLTFLDYPIHCDIVYFDYIQRSCSSLYRLLRFTNCPTYITLSYKLVQTVRLIAILQIKC